MNALTTTTKAAPSLLMDPQAFEHMQRVGAMLAISPLFPDHLRKGDKASAIANGVLVMNMAARLNEDPLTVAQNIYFVGGKPGWSSSYMIGKANQHGVFKNPISWEIKGQGDDLSVTAFAEVEATGQRVEATCSMAMAKAENWTKNSKYKSMPEQMLRYRSATFLIRLYCPEVMVGVPAQIEVEMGMKDVTPQDYAEANTRAKAAHNPEPEDAQIIEETAEEDKAATADEGDKAEAAKDDAPKEDKTEAENKGGDAPKEATPDPEQFQSLFDMITNDLNDAPDTDAVLELYAEQIEQMKEAAPELHEKLQEEIKAFDNQDQNNA